MRVVWLVHRTVVILLVIGGLNELADLSTWVTVAAVLFLIFATAPVAGWLQDRARTSAAVPRR